MARRTSGHLINGHLRLLRVTLERSAPCAWTVLQISKLHVMKARSSVTYIVNDLSCALIKFLNSSTSCLVKASRSPLSCSNVNTVGFVASHCNPSPPPALAAPQITSLSLLFLGENTGKGGKNKENKGKPAHAGKPCDTVRASTVPQPPVAFPCHGGGCETQACAAFLSNG